MLEDIISEWIRCINEYYRINRDGNYKFEVSNIDNKLKDDMFEFIKANKTLVQEQASTSIIQSHTQAYYTSRKLTEILVQEKSDCFEYYGFLKYNHKVHLLKLYHQYHPLKQLGLLLISISFLIKIDKLNLYLANPYKNEMSDISVIVLYNFLLISCQFKSSLLSSFVLS
ncbi:hypothetical protein RhiirC2_858904 [Rhizophagus irregularis]|uniref:Uncharacterized protein n=1 Tax=Rhizophagus irregularis TaxID=588596 RepID=A0A2N1M294_9GLOM|nr:hypothetical protein RhiirC2_858904 [Rhizophagus irregularis]